MSFDLFVIDRFYIQNNLIAIPFKYTFKHFLCM